MTRTTFSQADLTRRTQEVVDRAHHGEVAVIGSGQDQVVLLDALDFRLLQALAQCAISPAELGKDAEDPDAGALRAYLAAEISLGKAAELLGLHRLELQARLHRLGVPLHLGPATIEEARAEVAAARKFA
jgi:hypothetical protein